VIDFIKEIENRLGQYKRLPSTPFNSKCRYAIFPALEDYCVNERLYETLFKANKRLGNSYFIAKSFLDVKGEAISILKQEEMNWAEFERFQGLPLVYEGFYVTGNNFNWLGLYHPDDYFVLGANDELTNLVTYHLYGNDDWQSKLEEAFMNKQMDMYESDYKALKSKLFN
tara:strand:+ start:797 stop:1306 length:510 start_codon:yes stop_codon:yes gene_type:complete